MIHHLIEKINIKTKFNGIIRYDEPLSLHTTFKVGGPADVWIQPALPCFLEYTAILLAEAEARSVPVFVLGGGANTVFSDAGFRGIVLDTGAWKGECQDWEAGVRNAVSRLRSSPLPPLQSEEPISLAFRSGTPMDEAAETAASQGLGGLEFLAGVPGTTGGAAWMNVRCYGKSISDVLVQTHILDETHNLVSVPFHAEDFGYKRSPFQNRHLLLVSAEFAVYKKDITLIRTEMEEHRKDRTDKGHYRYPSAGSMFKNNPDFGKPTGKIIDELGLRSLTRGGAMVAPFHGNIIINTGNATAADIAGLVKEIQDRVWESLGVELETEVLFV
jgi:UDP-N-acetylmuramate dehydrogenase